MLPGRLSEKRQAGHYPGLLVKPQGLLWEQRQGLLLVPPLR
jgi:hypothetical protein